MTTIALVILDDDAGEVDRLSRELYVELCALDVKVQLDVDQARTELAKSAGANITAIIVALAGSPVLMQLVGLLRDWVTRGNDRKIMMRDGDRSLELTGVSAPDSHEIVRAFLGREVEHSRLDTPPS